MAIVQNLGNRSQPIDVPYTTPNRSTTTAVAPLYCGEIIYDTTLKECFVGLSINPIMWSKISYGIPISQLG
jgi:hypothetical protein